MSAAGVIKKALGLSELRSGIAAIAHKVRELERTVEQAKRSREELAAAPRTRDELASELDRWVDIQRQGFLEQFARAIEWLIRNPSRELTAGDGWSPLVGHGAQTHILTPRVAAGVLAPLVRESLRQAVMDLPDALFEGAVPMAERKQRIAELDAAIETGEAELAELRATADQAGIVLR